MTFLAAVAEQPVTFKHHILVAVLAVLGAVGYYVSLRIWPYADCGECNGGRKRRGRCRSCRGRGKRIRLGARLIYRKD